MIDVTVKQGRCNTMPDGTAISWKAPTRTSSVGNFYDYQLKSANDNFDGMTRKNKLRAEETRAVPPNNKKPRPCDKRVTFRLQKDSSLTILSPSSLLSSTTGKTQEEEEMIIVDSKQAQHAAVDNDVIMLWNVPLASEMTPDEKQRLWWSKSDYTKFKLTNERLSKSMQAQRRPSNQNIAPLETSYSQILLRIYNDCCDINNSKLCIVPHAPPPCDLHDFRHLVRWTKMAHCRRGLETQIVPFLDKDSKLRRENVLRAVLALQRNQKNNVKAEVLAETIRHCSERLTRPSGLFARVLGLADERLKVANEVKRRRTC